MWQVESSPAPWLRLSSLKAEQVLDEYDGPQLFTVRTTDRQLLLAYQCGVEGKVTRYLLVPTDPSIVEALSDNRMPIRDALLGRGWSFLVDRQRNGTLTEAQSIDVSSLPPNVLPRVGARLALRDDVLIRIRMIGATLRPGNIPASVVKKTIDSATGAIRALSVQALSMSPLSGRPSDSFRRYYDLPALEFGFRSFEMAFGRPDTSSELPLDDGDAIDTVRSLLIKGLDWATDPGAPIPVRTSEWSSIVDALAKLAPPLSGPIEKVEVSGEIAGRRRKPVTLTRHVSERIAAARKLMLPEARSKSFEGLVRELDKDKSTFMLRDVSAVTLCHVSFSEEQSADVSLAFETDQRVSITIFETTAPHELISMNFVSPPLPEPPPK